MPLFGPAFPRPEAIGDNLHRGHRRLAQTSVAGNLSAYPFALVAEHLSYGFQLTNDAVDFIHRSAREAPDQRIQVSSGPLIGLTVAGLAAQERDTGTTRRVFRQAPVRWRVRVRARSKRIRTSPLWLDHGHFSLLRYRSSRTPCRPQLQRANPFQPESAL